METEEDPSPHGGSGRRSGASAHRATCLRAPPANWDLPRLLPHLSSARWPGWCLRPRVPARTRLPILCPPGASLGTTARVSEGRSRSPPRRPRPVPTTHFLNPLQRHGSGRTRGHRPAGGGFGAGGRGVVAGSARRLLGWLSAVGPGSPLAGSLPAPVPVPCAPERECARVCGRGRRRDSFVSAFASGKEPAPSPSAPHPAWHTGKCSSSPSLLARLPREGSGDSLLTSTPQPGLAMARA